MTGYLYSIYIYLYLYLYIYMYVNIFCTTQLKYMFFLLLQSLTSTAMTRGFQHEQHFGGAEELSIASCPPVSWLP